MAASINREMLLSRIGDIEREMRWLRHQAALPDDVFLQDAREAKSARYALIVLVEAAAAICGHLAARLLREPVEAYPECFQTLAAGGLLDAALADRLTALARFRNILVHGYGRVDDSRMLRMLREDLGDLDAYVESVRAVLGGAAAG